jgi:hypothetical protein
MSRVTTITEACGLSPITSTRDAKSRSSALLGSNQGNESDIFGSTGIAITVLTLFASVTPFSSEPRRRYSPTWRAKRAAFSRREDLLSSVL